MFVEYKVQTTSHKLSPPGESRSDNIFVQNIKQPKLYNICKTWLSTLSFHLINYGKQLS